MILSVLVIERWARGRASSRPSGGSPRAGLVSELLAAFFEASVRLGVPLALAALGESITERSGVINIGLEGSIISGAFAAAVGALAWGAPGGMVAGLAAGGLTAAVFAFFALGLGADQIITGTAVTMGALGLTAAAYETSFGATGTALSLPTLDPLPVPFLAGLPLLGRALFAQPITAYVAYPLAIVLWWYLQRTAWGLELRAAGEEPGAAEAAGIPVVRTRVLATLFGGAMGGLAGVHLSLAHTATFAEGMSAGRGFIALAVVVLGRWHPLGVLAAALLFGAASALQFSLQALGLALPYQLFLSLPYLLTLLALAGWVGRTRAPAALGRPWPAGG